jgi:aminoglycoside/choline kinase family phosphotransferase
MRQEARAAVEILHKNPDPRPANRGMAQECLEPLLRARARAESRRCQAQQNQRYAEHSKRHSSARTVGNRDAQRSWSGDGFALAVFRAPGILPAVGADDSAFCETRSRAWIEATCASGVTELDELVGGAGARRYWRATLEDERTAILMHALPERAEILPPALRDQRAGIPFVEITAYLSRNGVPVPEIFGVEPTERWVLLEDLGDLHLSDLEAPARSARLEEAVHLLARIHALPPEDELPFERAFDEEWVRFELQTFLSHGLSSIDRGALGRELENLVEAVAQLPHTLCLRDYQSQNLMIDRHGRLRVLDYQDALLAPPELDLAALLFDSYIDIDVDERTHLLTAYAEHSGREPDPAALAMLVVQRKCKDFGRFLYLINREGEDRWDIAAASARRAVLQALPRLPGNLGRLSELLTAALTAVRP